MEIIKKIIQDSIKTKQKIMENINDIQSSAETIITCFREERKLLVCGNGGSAADSQHFATELVSRFEKNRKSLPAISLTTDTSSITATGNDFGFEIIFSRQVEGLGTKGDVLFAISTSGNSPNVLRAIEVAKQKKMKVICLTGKDGGKMKNIDGACNIIVPSMNTARIQESHIMIIHILCKIVEEKLFP